MTGILHIGVGRFRILGGGGGGARFRILGGGQGGGGIPSSQFDAMCPLVFNKPVPNNYISQLKNLII